MASSLEVADIIELWVWGSGQAMTFSQLLGHVETTIPEESIETSNDGTYDTFELFTQQVFDELIQRQKLLSESYPFSCDGYQIHYLQSESSSPYIFCLLLSYLPAEHIANAQRAPQFEILAMNAARIFFGGAALRIGWPWSTRTYEELLEQVIDLIPDLGAVNLPELVTVGDRGWDIVVVKSFGDNLFPRLVALGNCATGRHDWRQKGLETDPEYLWECFQHQRPGTWITFTAVPFRMNDNIRRRKASKTNLTFDRYRICELTTALDENAAQWVSEQYQNAVDLPLDLSI